jgi:predicted nuclease of predicted toxin-antitoxin system
MKEYLIDVNLPYYFALWSSDEYVHVRDIDDEWKDSQIWEYAKAHNLTIVTKDSDFSDRIILSTPPPRVIHIKFGNMKMREFYTIISSLWEEACQLSKQYKLLQVFKDRVEGIN